MKETPGKRIFQEIMTNFTIEAYMFLTLHVKKPPNDPTMMSSYFFEQKRMFMLDI